MEPDQVVEKLGGYGLWQIAITTFHGLAWAVLALDFSSSPYVVDTPPYHCKVPDNSTFNDTIPATWKDGELIEYEKCVQYVNRSVSNDTQPCTDGYWFDPEYGYDSTQTMDFELVCGKEIYVEIMMMTSTIIRGAFVLVANYLSDKFGRKTMYLVGVFSKPILHIAIGLSPNFWIQKTFDILAGIAIACYAGNAFILVLEMADAKKRTGLAVLMEIYWSLGLIAAVPVLYLCRNWRTLQFILAGISFPFCAAIFIPESITWLYSKKKFSRIKEIVKQAARWNRIDVPQDVMAALVEAENSVKLKVSKEDNNKNDPKETDDLNMYDKKDVTEAKPPNVIDLVRTPRVRCYTFIQIFIWCTNALVYVALYLTMTYMPGDRYMNLLSYAIAEMVAAILHTILLMLYGRRIPLVAFHLLGGIGLMLTILEAFKHKLQFNWIPMVVVFNFLGKLGISASYMTIFLYTPELYPTQIRSLAMGVFRAMTVVVDMASPYSRVLERKKPGLLRGLCGLMSMIAGFLGLFLPETHNRPLPETIEEIENMPRTARKEKIKDMEQDSELSEGLRKRSDRNSNV